MVRPRRSLHARISLLIAALLALALLASSAVWMRATRNAIREEMEAANRVADQWLGVLVAESRRSPEGGQTRLMSALRELGRLRAHVLEVRTGDAHAPLLYRSPEPTYKAGRNAPGWFADALAPRLAERYFDAGRLQLALLPDPSRSVLDAWDDLGGLLGWGMTITLMAWISSHLALNHALRPLREIGAAFARGADGRFDRRLSVPGAPELDLLASSYNRLAERLNDSLADNSRLEASQRFSLTLQERLEAERRAIARELHDELAQGITAVRSIAGAIQQRSTDQPGIHGSAQAIVAMAGQMHDGVRAILHRLRPPEPPDGELEETVHQLCAQWRALHPGIELDCRIDSGGPAVTPTAHHTVHRLLQESLTNVARHAGASRVEVTLKVDSTRIELQIADNGCGLTRACADPRPRYGLTGMQERTLELGGELHIGPTASGGLSVRATLPRKPHKEELAS